MANSELYLEDSGTNTWRPLQDTDLQAVVNATIGAVTLDAGTNNVGKVELDGGVPTSFANALAVTAKQGEGGDQILGATYAGLWVGTAGDIKVTMEGGGDFTFKNIANGTFLPIRLTHVKQAGTTADDVVALK